MKQMLSKWRKVTKLEYPQHVHLNPHPDHVDLGKLKIGRVMIETCNAAHRINCLLADCVNGHWLFCRNQWCNIWVKKAYFNDNLSGCCWVVCVGGFWFPCLCIWQFLCLCAHYSKGLGEHFRYWMKDNHSGELFFHVKRACSGEQQDIISMVVMTFFWTKATVLIS